jgi:hypothetical protein
MIPYDDTKLKAHTVSRMIRSQGLSDSDPSITEEYFYQDLQPLK